MRCGAGCNKVREVLRACVRRSRAVVLLMLVNC